MSWEPELEDLRRREELARRLGGAERVERQHASGRLTVRERVERLFDAGSFHETGAIAGKGVYDDAGELVDFTPANVMGGQGRLEGPRRGGERGPPRGGGGRRLPGARRCRRCRHLGEDPLRRADGPGAAPAADPAGGWH